MPKNIPYSSFVSFKSRCEKALSAVFGAWAVFHLLFTMGKYVIGREHNLTALKIDRYMGLAAVLLVAVYVILLITKYQKYAKSTLGSYLRYIFSGGNLWLVILFVWYLIACAALSSRMGSSIFTANDRFLLDVFISFFALYMISWSKTVYDVFIHILMLVETVFMIWVLYNIFRLNVLRVPGGQIGMAENYNLIIACHRNTTGAYAAIFLMLALYMISVKKGVVRLLYAVAAGIQLFPLYLSNSRTAYLSCVIAIAVAGFFAVQRKYTGKNKMLLSLGCGIICGACIYFLRYGILGIYDGVTHLSEQLNIPVTEAIRDVDITNTSGRLKIWKASLRAMVFSFESFLIGVTPARVEGMLGYMQNIENYALYTHNQFLQMGVAFGVPGLLFYCLWLLKTAKQCWKVAFKGRYWMIACTILMLVVANLTESYLVAYFYFCGVVFFLLCGMVRTEAAELDASDPSKPQRTKSKKK